MDLQGVAQIIHLDHLTLVVAFHAQPRVEKYFIAIFEENSRNAPKGYSTLRLYDLTTARVPIEVDADALNVSDNPHIEAR